MTHYLAQLCATIALSNSVHVIVLGGGVMQRHSLFAKIRAQFKASLNGYLSCERMFTDQYIVASQFGEHAGAVGSLVLASDIHKQQQQQQQQHPVTTSANKRRKSL